MKNAFFECSIAWWVEERSVPQLAKNNIKIINILFHCSYFARDCFHRAIFPYWMHKVITGKGIRSGCRGRAAEQNLKRMNRVSEFQPLLHPQLQVKLRCPFCRASLLRAADRFLHHFPVTFTLMLTRLKH